MKVSRTQRPRNSKSMRPPSAVIIFMTYFYRAGVPTLQVYREKGTLPKKGGGLSFTVTKLPSSLKPKG